MIEINSDKKLNANFSSGFTLMEVMLSVTILSMGIVGSFSLISSSMAKFSSASNKIIAANLAQDGIERVRQMRDRNWLREKTKEHGHISHPWDDGIDGESNEKYIKFPCVIGVSKGKISGSLGDPDGAERDLIDACILNTAGNNCQVFRYYNGTSWNSADSTEKCISDDRGEIAGYSRVAYSGFYRLIHITKISTNNYSNRVEVTVRWTDQSGMHYFTAEEVLYNWKETIP